MATPPVNAKLHPRELVQSLEDSVASTIFVSSKLAGRLEQALTGSPAGRRVGQGLFQRPAACRRRVFNSSKRADTSRMTDAIPIIAPSASFRGTMVNSTEMRLPSLRSAGTDSRSPLP
ncbi:hypothetical protein FZ983_14590 [Azospirillum sp. B21]|nr:hypothetical protein FZ983_14590 [Azospirillum sp. B21]